MQKAANSKQKIIKKSRLFKPAFALFDCDNVTV